MRIAELIDGEVIYRDMTPEEAEVLRNAQDQIQDISVEDRLNIIEDVMMELLGGTDQ